MNGIPLPQAANKRSGVPPLTDGERLTQREFHRRYEAYPKNVKFELIGGIVYMASPLRIEHSDSDEELGHILGLYRRRTPGIKHAQNATTILGDASEPQPDQGLFILTEFGGRSWFNANGYLEGPPELLGEIAYSTARLDLHVKKVDYEKAGVLEYIVVSVEAQELHWFHFPSGRKLKPDAAGIYRSRVFPGLWIDGPALLACNSRQLTKVLRQGLASPEHAAFVKRLRIAHKKHKK